MAHRDDGTYAVRFRSSLGAFGAGVVVIRDLEVSGGDSAFVFSGRFVERDGALVGVINVDQHSRGMISIFGARSKFSLNLRGKLNGVSGIFEGAIIGEPALRVSIELQRAHSIAAE